MYKVIGNFSCDKIECKIGEVKSSADLSSISGHIDFLIKDKLLEELPKQNTAESLPAPEIIESESVKIESPKETKKKNKGV